MNFTKIMLFLCVVLLSSCTFNKSPATRYYVLALPGIENDNRQLQNKKQSVNVGPISIPGYLDRQQLFIRDPNLIDVQLKEYDRWGESLQDGINRVLIESINLKFKNSDIVALPLRSSFVGNLRISVDVLRFDGSFGDKVVLDAAWNIIGAEGKIISQGRFIDEEIAGLNISSLIQAHSVLLNKFGQALSELVLTELKRS